MTDAIRYSVIAFAVTVGVSVEVYALVAHVRGRRDRASSRLLRRRIVNWYGARSSGRGSEAPPASPAAACVSAVVPQPQHEPPSRPEPSYPAAPLASRRA